VVAVCDNVEIALKRAAEKFPEAHTYVDFRGLLDVGGVDAIIAAASPQVHHEVALASLQRGIHVFVEKPPTVTTVELANLASLAKRTGLVTGVGHNLRHATASLELQKCIAHESFGSPICMDMWYFASKPVGDRWGLKSALRSFLLSHANHALDLMAFHMGSVESITALATQGPQGTIAMSAQLEFKSGAVGNVLVTTCAPHFSLSLSVVGDQRTVAHMDGLRGLSQYGRLGDQKRWGRKWTERTLDSGFEHAGYQTELELFFDAVRGHRQMHPTFEDELAVYRLMDDIERQVSSRAEMSGVTSR